MHWAFIHHSWFSCTIMAQKCSHFTNMEIQSQIVDSYSLLLTRNTENFRQILQSYSYLCQFFFSLGANSSYFLKGSSIRSTIFGCNWMNNENVELATGITLRNMIQYLQMRITTPRREYKMESKIRKRQQYKQLKASSSTGDWAKLSHCNPMLCCSYLVT